jgi:hypothetical protein
MSNICILTSYTDHIRWDNYGKCDYGDLASLNHHEYSNKHGYSYIKEIVKNDNYSDWHPTWIKIDVLKKYLPLFDYVVWIDADAIFVNQDIKIEDMITDNVDLVIPKLEVDRVSGNMWTHTTTGFMVFKNSEWSNHILNELWNNPKQFKFEFFHEQSRLDELIYDNFKLDSHGNILNKVIDDIEHPLLLNNIRILPYSYHRCWEDGVMNYVYHAGGSTPTKFERIKKILENKIC